MTRYRLFGLVIESAFELPGVPRADAGEPADAVIARAGTTPIPAHQDFQPGANGGSFAVGGVARFDVSGGDRIDVTADPGADPRNVRLYLQGSALGLLLHQRGMLPLHANAVAIDGQAIAFMGKSGAGKSTLAAWFHDAGFPLLTDDVCVVTLGADDNPLAWPGLPRLRLWREEVLASGRDPGALEPSFAGDSEFDKFDVPMAAGQAAQAPLPLGAVFVLEAGQAVSATPLVGSEAVDALFAHTYRGALVAVGSPKAHWRTCLAIARAGLVHRLTRPWGHDRRDDVGTRILRVARDAARPS